MSKLLLGDVELLATGASERFRRRYTKHSGAVGHVDHTIAPAARGNGESGGAWGADRFGHSTVHFGLGHIVGPDWRAQAIGRKLSPTAGNRKTRNTVARHLWPRLRL